MDNIVFLSLVLLIVLSSTGILTFSVWWILTPLFIFITLYLIGYANGNK